MPSRLQVAGTKRPTGAHCAGIFVARVGSTTPHPWTSAGSARRGLLQIHAALTKALDAELEAAHGLSSAVRGPRPTRRGRRTGCGCATWRRPRRGPQRPGPARRPPRARRPDRPRVVSTTRGTYANTTPAPRSWLRRAVRREAVRAHFIGRLRPAGSTRWRRRGRLGGASPSRRSLPARLARLEERHALVLAVAAVLAIAIALLLRLRAVPRRRAAACPAGSLASSSTAPCCDAVIRAETGVMRSTASKRSGPRLLGADAARPEQADPVRGARPLSAARQAAHQRAADRPQ